MIREYHRRDLDPLLLLYQQQGFDYEVPRLDDPIFFAKLVLEGERGIEMALAARHTCEVFAFLDGTQGTPQERWQKFLRLHAGMEVKVKEEFGLDDAHCFLPPEIERSFGKRLRLLGWVKDEWPCYSKVLMLPSQLEQRARVEVAHG